jgi:putative DNA-invertase from lambdoid prophage Rac
MRFVADEGVSGVAVPLAERPQGRRLFDMLRRGDVLVVRWVDRLGRNYSDVCDNIREFMRRGVGCLSCLGARTISIRRADGREQQTVDNCPRRGHVYP